MKKPIYLTLLAIGMAMASCESNSYTTKCPCVIVQSQKISDWYSYQVEGVEVYFPHKNKTFEVSSSVQYNIGDTLKFVTK